MAALKLFSAFLLILCIFQQGTTVAATCGKESIVVTQKRTGKIVEGKLEYEVTVANKCGCPQSKVMAICYGLSSVERVDPQAIKPVDDTKCLVNGGRPLVHGSPVKFKYAWLTPQDFPIVSSFVSC